MLGRILDDAGIEHAAFHDMGILAPGILDRFDALVTYTQHAPGHPMGDDERGVLDGFLARGGGFLGIHGATASFKENTPYHELVGGRFTGHGLPCKITATIVDPDHPITRGLAAFTVKDEPYEHELLGDPVHVLVDRPGKSAKREPVAWIKQHGQGRVAYLALGHHRKSLEAPPVDELLRRAIAWVAGRDAP